MIHFHWSSAIMGLAKENLSISYQFSCQCGSHPFIHTPTIVIALPTLILSFLHKPSHPPSILSVCCGSFLDQFRLWFFNDCRRENLFRCCLLPISTVTQLRSDEAVIWVIWVWNKGKSSVVFGGDLKLNGCFVHIGNGVIIVDGCGTQMVQARLKWYWSYPQELVG